MAFTVYPDAATAALLGTPPNTPVLLMNGVGMAVFAPLAGHVGPDPSAGNLNTTFIRISMSGAAAALPPQVELRAVNPVAGTEGASVIVTGTSLGTANALLNGINTTTAASAYFLGPHANNVYLLKVVISIAGTTLKLKITNNTADQRDFVWVAASDDAQSQQPWIHVTPDVLTYTALVNQTSTQTAQSLQITNRGTGSLTVTGVTPAIAAPYTIAGLPAMLTPNPAMSTNVTIGFNAPAVIGDTPLAGFTIDSTDPGPVFGVGHNRQFNLSATTSKLEVALALDDSGSMSWLPGGTDPGVLNDPNSRWSELQSAVKLFLPLLGTFGENKGTFGLVKFPGRPDRPINDVTSYDFDPAVTAQPIPSAADMVAGPNTQIDAALPFYQGTPMFYGLERLLTAAPPYFATDAASRDRNVRWILLMSDGAWNSSPDPRGKLGDLVAGKIKVYSAGYGTAGEVDYDTLEALSIDPGATPGGLALQVDAGAGYTATALANAFKAAIKTGLTSITSPGDPTNVLHAGDAEARHPMIITPYDTKAAFMIDWNTPDAGRMILQLLTPTCDLLTPENARDGRTSGVTFSGDLRHQLYVIDESYLRNDADPSQPRYGTWWMIVTSPPLSDGAYMDESELYAYDVMVESSLQIAVSLDRPVYYAGDPISLSAKLTANGLPIANAAVKLELTMPGQAMANWLAAAPVSAEEFQQAAEILSAKDTYSSIYIKSYAAQLKGILFDNPTRTATIPMTDPDNRGIYTATFSQTPTPDSYKLYVTAVGTTQDGVVFRRERAVQVIVGVRPDPKFTLFDLLYEPFPQDPKVITAVVRVTPRDRFGNVVLIDPAISQDIVLQAEGGKFADQLTTNFDGTYTTQLVYDAGSTPIISLEVAGQPVFKDRPITPVDRLVYVDQVLRFLLGAEGEQDANQHTNPEDALGDVRKKEPNVFVSLGAYGVLAVGLRNHIILAQGEDDITVFVQPDTDLRPYLVEALLDEKDKDDKDKDDKDKDGKDRGDKDKNGKDRDVKGKWVKIGESAGITQSFSLSAAELKATRAIRITDISGRTHDSDFKAIQTPGVSIRGVGVKVVGKTAPQPLGDVEVKEIRGIKDSEVKRLTQAGVTTLDQLAHTEPTTHDVDIAPSRFIDLRAKAIVTLDAVVELRPIKKLASWTLWRISNAPLATLQDAADVPQAEIDNLLEQVNTFRLALRKRLLMKLTLGQLTGE